MPRRSNAFQKLIRRIYTAIQPSGATLIESALLAEFDTKTMREVDVLIELRVSDSVLRMGIECRDHSRAADVKWIDELIGKYQRLSVDRVIAVSRSGFTTGAIAKAEANRIETRTLKAALEADWPAELQLVSVGRFAPILSVGSIDIVCAPPWPDVVPPIAIVVKGQNQTPDAFMQSLVEQLHASLWPLLPAQVGKTLEVMADFDKTLTAQFEVEFKDTSFIDQSGGSHQVSKMKVLCDLTFEHELLPTERHLFGAVGVTRVTDLKAAESITLMMVQEPGKSVGRPVVFGATNGKDIVSG
jgi:restriction endonuclease